MPQQEIQTVTFSFLGYGCELVECSDTFFRFMRFVAFVVRCLLLLGTTAVAVWSVNTMIDAGRAQFWPCAAMMAAAYIALENTK